MCVAGWEVQAVEVGCCPGNVCPLSELTSRWVGRPASAFPDGRVPHVLGAGELDSRKGLKRPACWTPRAGSSPGCRLREAPRLPLRELTGGGPMLGPSGSSCPGICAVSVLGTSGRGVYVRRQVHTLPECCFAQLSVLPSARTTRWRPWPPLPSAVGGHTSHFPHQGFAQDFGRGPQHMSTSQLPVTVTLFGEKGLRRCDPVKGMKGVSILDGRRG